MFFFFFVFFFSVLTENLILKGRPDSMNFDITNSLCVFSVHKRDVETVKEETSCVQNLHINIRPF